MNAEIIAIGSELTSGAKLDTNSQWLSQQLTDLGIDVDYHTTVADDLAANVAVLQTADALRRVAREAVLDLAADGVVYAELRYAPEQHLAGGLSLQDVVDAVRAGVDEGVAQVREAGTPIFSHSS